LIGVRDRQLDATVQPGMGVGTLIVGGDVEFGERAVVEIEISERGADLLRIRGKATLGGELVPILRDGFVPPVGTVYEVVAAEGVVGSTKFGQTVFAMNDLGGLIATQNGGSTLLTEVQYGDMNMSGEVNAEDLPYFALALRDAYSYDEQIGLNQKYAGMAAPSQFAEISGDGRLTFDDIDDFITLVAEGGDALSMSQVLAAINAVAVPEPSSAWLGACAAAWLARRRRDGKRSALPASRLQRNATSAAHAGFTLVELLVVVTIIGILIALLLPAIQAARESARQASCRNQLRQLATALHNFLAQHQTFPSGADLHPVANQESLNWAVRCLPYLEQQSLYDSVDIQTDGSFKHSPRTVYVGALTCPAAEPQSTRDEVVKYADYSAVAGGGVSQQEWELEQAAYGSVFTDGVLHLGDPVRPAEVTDGTSQTLLLGESSYRADGVEHWALGAIWQARSPRPTPEPEPTRVRVAAAKNVVWPINSAQRSAAFYVLDADAPPERRKMLNNDLAFGSEHPGGALFARADGSVGWLDETISLDAYYALASRNGEESVQP
ncbi:MAG: DUF1559 domain-containing protein, partial [Planctomycetales bacterium]|nr:DUF1559 domain-containing protein [Planctomycetales bacterium]